MTIANKPFSNRILKKLLIFESRTRNIDFRTKRSDLIEGIIEVQLLQKSIIVNQYSKNINLAPIPVICLAGAFA